MSVLDRVVAGVLPAVPRPIVWRVARRYIAGRDLAAAVGVVRELKERGLHATVDYLGEGVTERSAAEESFRTYLGVLDRIEAEGLPSGISVKLSQLGLGIDRALAREHVELLAARAAKARRFVRIDMEDSSVTDATLALYREVHERHLNVGIVLQAYLRRTVDDARALLPLRPDVRVCKGIYNEPEERAFRDPEAVRECFLETVRILLEGGARVATATHDPRLIDRTLELSDRLAVGPERHEYQMLLGVGRSLWQGITSRGRRLRIYVPFGRHWYPYCLRRLRENPRIAGYVFRDLLLPA